MLVLPFRQEQPTWNTLLKNLTTCINLFSRGVRRGGNTGICSSPGNWDWKAKIYWQLEVSSLIPIHRFNSCNFCLFACMTLMLHKVEEPGPLLWCHVMMSLQFIYVPLLCLQRKVAKLASDLFYYLSLLCNNKIATNLQRFTASSCGSRRFTAYTTGETRHLGRYNATRQWLLVASGPCSFILCEKRYEWICSDTMLPQLWQTVSVRTVSVANVSVSNYTYYAGFTSRSRLKLRGLLEYVYTSNR